MQRWMILGLFLASLSTAGAAQAAPRGAQQLGGDVSEPNMVGLGLMLGSPTGFTVKGWMGRNAWDAGVGFYAPGLRFHADYIWGLAQLLRDRSVMDLDLYAGAGPMLGVLYSGCGVSGFGNYCGNGDVYFGGRVPVGIEAVLHRAPIALGLELAPALGIASHAGAALVLDGMLNVRFLLR